MQELRKVRRSTGEYAVVRRRATTTACTDFDNGLITESMPWAFHGFLEILQHLLAGERIQLLESVCLRKIESVNRVPPQLGLQSLRASRLECIEPDHVGEVQKRLDSLWLRIELFVWVDEGQEIIDGHGALIEAKRGQCGLLALNVWAILRRILQAQCSKGLLCSCSPDRRVLRFRPIAR